jgi:hypothetical protein
LKVGVKAKSHKAKEKASGVHCTKHKTQHSPLDEEEDVPSQKEFADLPT